MGVAKALQRSWHETQTRDEAEGLCIGAKQSQPRARGTPGAWELRAERVRGRERPQSPRQPGTPRDPGRVRQSGGGCMRLEDSVVATAGPAPETGRGGEQPRPPAGQGCGARGEPGGGGPQDSCQQREFPSGRRPRAVESG